MQPKCWVNLSYTACTIYILKNCSELGFSSNIEIWPIFAVSPGSRNCIYSVNVLAQITYKHIFNLDPNIVLSYLLRRFREIRFLGSYKWPSFVRIWGYERSKWFLWILMKLKNNLDQCNPPRLLVRHRLSLDKIWGYPILWICAKMFEFHPVFRKIHS